MLKADHTNGGDDVRTSLVAFALCAALGWPSPARATECLAHRTIYLARISGQAFAHPVGGWQPASGLKLELQRIGGQEKWPPPLSTETDADGAFVFEGLKGGRYSLRVCDRDGTQCDRMSVVIVKRREWSDRALFLEKHICVKACVADAKRFPLELAPECIWKVDGDTIP